MKANTVAKKIWRRIIALAAFLIWGPVVLYGDGLPGDYFMIPIRTVTAGHSPLTNPAFITEENYLSLRGAYLPGKYWQLLKDVGITMPLGRRQAIGLTFTGEFQTGKIHEGSIDNGGKLVVGEESQATSYTIFGAASYAANVWNRLSIGANVNCLISSFYHFTDVGFSPDVGMTYRLFPNDRFGNHILGMSLNLGIIGMENAERDVGVKFSWLGRFSKQRIEGAIDFDIRKSGWYCHASTGAWLYRVFKIYALGGFSQRHKGYAGIASGVNIPSINNGRDLEFLLQYTGRFSDYSFDRFVTLLLRVALGKHRNNR